MTSPHSPYIDPEALLGSKARDIKRRGRSARAAFGFLASAVLAGAVSCAQASPIEYSISGDATGTLGATPFTAAAFTITGVADTADIYVNGSLDCIQLTSITFSVEGVGSGAVVESMSVFRRNAVGTTGLQFGPCPGNIGDWHTSTAAALNGWHLVTPIGPVNLGSPIAFTSELRTTRGTLTLANLAGGSFRARESAAAAEARAGLFDPTFANGGKAVYAAPEGQTFFAYVMGIVVQPDAGIAFTGYTDTESGFVRRLKPSGAIDATFGVGGTASALMPNAFALALQSNGSYVVAGGSPTGFRLTRLSASGVPDPTFGPAQNGTAQIPFGLAGAYAAKVLLQPDGKIVVVGVTNSAGSATLNSVAIARLLPSGVPDPGFGGGGSQVAVYPSGATVTIADAALQADGKLVIVGDRRSPGASPILLRYTADGQLDPTFLTGAPESSGMFSIRSVAVQADGKLVLSGDGGPAGAPAALALRLAANGASDATYGVGGVFTLPLSGTTLSVASAALQPDARLVLLLKDYAAANRVPRLARVTSAGALDPTFGVAGLSRIENVDLPDVRSIALQADGKLLVGTEIQTGAGAGRLAHLAVLRFQSDSIAGTVVIFYNTILNHFFITASPAEQAAIDGGSAGPGWTRNGQSFKSGGVSRVCRFYGTPGIGPNSHFYTVEPGECAQVRMDPGWHFESYDFSATPASPEGGCASGTVPIFRAYNHRFAENDSNHRYTGSPNIYNAQLDLGWTPEGIVFCVPK